MQDLAKKADAAEKKAGEARKKAAEQTRARQLKVVRKHKLTEEFLHIQPPLTYLNFQLVVYKEK